MNGERGVRVPVWIFNGLLAIIGALLMAAWADIKAGQRDTNEHMDARFATQEQRLQELSRQVGVLEGRTAWLDSERAKH